MTRKYFVKPKSIHEIEWTSVSIDLEQGVKDGNINHNVGHLDVG